MGPIRLTFRSAVALMVLAALTIAAASALAGVTVYKNAFSRKGQVKQMRHAGGKHCKRGFEKRTERLRIDVTKGPEVCGYRPPVQGDTDGPDHNFQANVKFLKST